MTIIIFPFFSGQTNSNCNSIRKSNNYSQQNGGGDGIVSLRFINNSGCFYKKRKREEAFLNLNLTLFSTFSLNIAEPFSAIYIFEFFCAIS